MNDSELNRLLKSAAVPGRPAGYWEAFPDLVASRLAGLPASRPQRAPAEPRRVALGWFALGAGVATACLLLAFNFISDHEQGEFTAGDLAVMRKYLQEVETLFPNQVQAVVFEREGPRLVLADRASVPASLPVYVRVCDAKGCRSFLTFSGQQIRLDGEMIDVLVNARGHVLLVGSRLAWSSEDAKHKAGSLRIVARALDSVS